MNNYVSAYGHYPPAASRDPEGRKLLSWRVHVLQFGDESQQQLYSQFHLNEPWDSEHNRKFIERMPKNYASPGSGFYGKGLSNYLVPVGEGLAFSGTEGIPLKEFKDGISRTIFIVDVDPSHAVIWTKPEDLDVDLQQPFHGLINDAKLEFVATRGDATVTVHDKRLSADALRAMFTRNGGEHLNR